MQKVVHVNNYNFCLFLDSIVNVLKLVETNMKSKTDSNDDIDSELGKKLSDMIKFKKKLSTKKPKLIINLRDDLKAEANGGARLSENHLPQFFVHDLQRASLYILVASQYKIIPSWCKILRPKEIKSLVLITVNGLCEDDYQKMKPELAELDSLFTNKNNQTIDSFTFVSSHANKRNFYDDFTMIPSANLKWVTKTKITKEKNQLSRVSLLLSVEQMLKEDYPLPFDNSHSFENFVFSKPSYEPVDDSSPLYGVDCEMCYNVDGEMEVVWIAIVDENLECVYETLVKPSKQIQSYLTHITGVSESKLRNVCTTLNDVRNEMARILPANAILCGQSLNNDLHALKMFHPYVIDTSVIYNISGAREQKTSLKFLALQFLKEKIQQQSHNPVFDARVSLKLVLLKLKHGLEFGDVIINGIPNENFSENNNYETIYDLFERLSVSSVLIDRKVEREDSSLNCFKFVEASSNKIAYRALEENVNKAKFVWCQLYNDKKFKIKEFLENLKETNRNISDDSFIIVAFTGDMLDENEKIKRHELENYDSLKNFYKGRFFIRNKDDQSEKLGEEIKILYDLVKNKDS